MPCHARGRLPHLMRLMASPPAMKIHGKMTPGVATGTQRQALGDAHPSGDAPQAGGRVRGDQGTQLRHLPSRIGRFHVNCFVQIDCVGMVRHLIATTSPTSSDLKLPPVLKDVTMTKRRPGDLRRRHRFREVDLARDDDRLPQREVARAHYRHRGPGRVRAAQKNPQRGVLDTDCWEAALKNTLRQAPDVILIGEIRDMEVTEHAVASSSRRFRSA